MDGGDDHHVVLFPFMSKGHTIPLLHLARLLLLLRRQISVTVITTPANLPFISNYLSDAPAASILPLPFPKNIPGVPVGVESTDNLPNVTSLFVPFSAATAAMQPHFDLALQTLLTKVRVSSSIKQDMRNVLLVSDGFLWWTQDSADRLGIPRIAFLGMSGYATSVMSSIMGRVAEHDGPAAVPDFPWIKVSRSDFTAPFNEREPGGDHYDLVMKQVGAWRRSRGMIFNSFYELEPVFADYWNRNFEPKGWWVGPLCLAQPLTKSQVEPEQRPLWSKWLDHKSEQERPVLYVAFGTQAEISTEQLKEIAVGLERSEINFMWVIRTESSELPEGYEERVKNRGLIVREWVDQREVLAHVSVCGFLTHCGWNSVVEGVCTAVPMLAWPMMAEQPLNAKMVVEELKVGIRVAEGATVVAAGEVERAVRELMEGEKGKEARKAVREYARKARMAMAEGGSSWRALGSLLDEIATTKKKVSTEVSCQKDINSFVPKEHL